MSGIAVDAGVAETAVTHVAIELQLPGAHGASQDLLGPVMSHGPPGIPEEASLTATMVAGSGPGVPRDESVSCSAARALVVLIDPMSCSPCMRQSVPLASRDSWSSSALESRAVRR